MQLCRLGVAGGHAGRSRDAKPGTSHREEVTAILHAAINLCSLTLLLFYSERKCLRHVYVYAKCGDVKKRKSRHASLAKIPPTHLIVGARNCVLREATHSLETRPPPSVPYAIARADN